MKTITFDIKTYDTEHDAYRAFEKALTITVLYTIPHTHDIRSKAIFKTTDVSGKMVTCRSYSITFPSMEDYNTYLIIKD